MNSYEPNQKIDLSATFVPPEGSDLDPPVQARLGWRNPQGEKFEVNVDADEDTPGTFEYTIDGTKSGIWRYRWWTDEGDGGFVVENSEGAFFVRYSEVVG
jgi:hypothetical protein